MIASYDVGELDYAGACLSYRIDDISVTVRSELPEVADDFAALYRGYGRGCPGSRRTIHMEVRRTGRTWLGRSRYLVFGDGEGIGRERRREDVLPFLEWGINWQLIATHSEFLQLHAAAMVRDGQGVIFAGASGCGKSTLVAGLLGRGWKYLSDEFALIDPNTLDLRPFPKAVCVKAGAFEIVQRLNLPFAGPRCYVKGIKGKVGYINPYDIAPDAIPGPAPVRFVIFPKYLEGCAARLRPVARARAAFMLAGSGLNRDVFADRALSILADVARGAECFSLECGSIDETCDLLEALFEGAL